MVGEKGGVGVSGFMICKRMFVSPRAKISERLDVIIGILGIFIGTLVIYLSYAANLRQQDVGFAILIPCLIYLAFRSKLIKSAHDRFIPSKSLILLSNIVFLIAFTASIILLRSNLYYRPPLYFILVSIACATIAVEIFYSDENPRVGWIIAKILLMSLSVRAGIFYGFPGLMGADIWHHVKCVALVADLGHLPGYESVMAKYVDYPIFHLDVAITHIITSLDAKDSLFASIGFLSVMCTIFIYLIGKSIAGTKVGLLAMLFANMSDMILIRGICNITPGSLVLCLFLIILYIVFKYNYELKSSAIVLFLILVLVITHQLSTFASFMSLIGIFIGKLFYDFFYSRKEKSTLNISLTTMLMFIVALETYWISTYQSPTKNVTFFDFALRPIIRVLRTGDFFSNPASNPYVIHSGYYNILSNILFHFGYLILLFLAVIGVLIWLSYSKIDNRKLSITTAILILYLIIYGVSLSSFKDSMLPHRWLPFAYIFLALAASYGVFGLTKLVKTERIKITAIFCIVFILTFFMITTPIVNRDSPIYAQERAVRSMFKASEIQGASTITNVYEGRLVSDGSLLSGLFRGLTYNATLERIGPSKERYTGLILLRKAMINEPVSVGRAGLGLSEILGEEFFDEFDNSNYDLVYNNGEVVAYKSGN